MILYSKNKIVNLKRVAVIQALILPGKDNSSMLVLNLDEKSMLISKSLDVEELERSQEVALSMIVALMHTDEKVSTQELIDPDGLQARKSQVKKSS